MESLEKELLQWIKGEKMGDVETVKGIDNEWTMFESGGRIYTELINEFLSPVQGEPLDFGLTPTAVVNPTPPITPPIPPTMPSPTARLQPDNSPSASATLSSVLTSTQHETNQPQEFNLSDYLEKMPDAKTDAKQ